MAYKNKERQREVAHQHYLENKLDYLARKKSRELKLREMINKAKNVPCLDCGDRHPPYVMDFDHVRGEKSFNIGGSVAIGSPKKLLEEIAKCDVVCSNCHRKRTHSRVV